MSHVSDLKLRIKDLDALEAALPPELELRRDKKTFAWWGRFEGDSTPPPGRDPKDYGKCEHAIGYRGVQPRNGSSGEWEIGLVPALEGEGYDLMADEFGSAGMRLKRHLPHIRQHYAATVATQTAVERLSRYGWRAQQAEMLPNGILRVRLKH